MGLRYLCSGQNRRVNDGLQLITKVEGAAGHQSGHEDDDQLFHRIDPEGCTGRTALGIDPF